MHPTVRLLGEYMLGYVDAVRRAPIPAREKRECYRHLAALVLDRATSKVTRREMLSKADRLAAGTIARRSRCVTPWRVGRSPRGEIAWGRGPTLEGSPGRPGS